MEGTRPERRLKIATRRFLKSVGVPMGGKRISGDRTSLPAWFGWLSVAAMFLLVVVRLRIAGEAWNFPLLSLGEWLLLPLGAASLTMGLLAGAGLQGKSLLPRWMGGLVPAVLWLAAAGAAMLANGVGPAGGDLFLSWVVHLVFPTMAFLPLLAQPAWRDRLMWALAAGLTLNAVLIFWQARAAGVAPPDPRLLGFGGLLADHHSYATLIGVAIPILAAWRGGNAVKNRAISMMFCTFLLPALALATCFSWPGILAVSAGLAVSWAAWRSSAWLLGIFLCLLIFGYGGQAERERHLNQRRLLNLSTKLGAANYQKALDSFEARPILGSGPESYLPAANAAADPTPWYAALLGGTGLVGLGMWLALLGELAARAIGRSGRRCILFGGVLGGVAGLAVAGLWTEALPQGAGAMIGLLIALSILEEPERPERRSARARNRASDAAMTPDQSVAKAKAADA